MEIYNLLEIRKPSYLKYIESINQYTFVKNMGDYMSVKTHNPKAASIYQTLMQEANVGYDQPVFIDDKTQVACCTKGYVYVNENVMNKIPYGAQRFVMFHESRHIKNGDIITGNMFIFAAYASIFAIYVNNLKLIKDNIPLRQQKLNIVKCCVKDVCMFGAAYYLLKVASTIWRWDIETRADIEAASEVKCHKCIEDFSNTTSIQERKFDYLGKKELIIIQDYYKKQNLKCTYHSLE
jgi:hypothetical protein